MVNDGPPRRVVLCADDYGMSGGVSRAIVELAWAGRVSATSVMVLAPRWREFSRDLVPLAGRVGIGLHLTFTWGASLGPMPRLAPDGRLPSLRALVGKALTSGLPRAELAAEIERQLDSFEAGLGRPPDFVDGHQHVHALPGIRSALLDTLTRRRLAGRLWIRDPADSARAILGRGGAVGKAAIVAGLASGFGRACRQAGFHTNRGFAGFSSFDPGLDLRSDFARFLARPGPEHLVMCHPGHVAPGERLDGVEEARGRELAFLDSDAFPALLRERGIELAPAPG